MLIGSLRLNQLYDVEIKIAKIEECHTVSKALRTTNSYYLQSIVGRSSLVNKLESSLKHTKGDFLWVLGNWKYGAGLNRLYSVPRVLGTPPYNILLLFLFGFLCF